MAQPLYWPNHPTPKKKKKVFCPKGVDSFSPHPEETYFALLVEIKIILLQVFAKEGCFKIQESYPKIQFSIAMLLAE